MGGSGDTLIYEYSCCERVVVLVAIEESMRVWA